MSTVEKTPADAPTEASARDQLLRLEVAVEASGEVIFMTDAAGDFLGLVAVHADELGVDVAERMLRGADIDVRTAVDPAATLSSIARETPSAIVLDYHLPTMNGIELLKRIKASPGGADVPVAVVTGDYLIDEHVPAELKELGAELFFKPLWQDQLVEIVRGMIGSCARIGAAG